MRKTAIGLSVAAALALGGGVFWMNFYTTGDRDGVNSSAQQALTTSTAPKAITWEDLLPVGEQLVVPLESASDFFDNKSAPFASSETGGAPSPMMSVPVPTAEPRQDMANTFIKLAGYMTPFNVESGKTRSFLLVPYVGACIHVPAPPANQIVLVETKEPVEVREMWQPFEAIGTLRIENISTGLAEVAYTMELDRIEPYILEEVQTETN